MCSVPQWWCGGGREGSPAESKALTPNGCQELHHEACAARLEEGENVIGCACAANALHACRSITR